MFSGVGSWAASPLIGGLLARMEGLVPVDWAWTRFVIAGAAGLWSPCVCIASAALECSDLDPKRCAVGTAPWPAGAMGAEEVGVVAPEECAFAERCKRCIAAAEPASDEAYSQVKLRLRHLVQGLDSSHLTRAFAQAWQACATRPAPGDELMRRLLVPLPSSSWLARCLFSRSARPKALPQT